MHVTKDIKINEVKSDREINKYFIIAEEFNTHLSVIDKASRQKISKDTTDMNITISLLDLIHSHRRVYSITAE